MGKLDGRVAIITGAGRGIGRATAELFAREGASVVIATRSRAPGEAVVAAIQAAGREAMLVTLDVGDRAAVSALVAQAVERFGRLDIVLHNAAHMPVATLNRLTDAELTKTLDVGLKAAFWLTQDALPYLKQSPAARLLFTSSVVGNRKSFPGFIHHGVVKMGLNAFIRGAGLELSRTGITVNGIEPSGIRTSYFDDVSAEVVAKMAAERPIARLAEPMEVAHGFLYLASDEASYVTGQTIVIDGGATLGGVQGLSAD